MLNFELVHPRCWLGHGLGLALVLMAMVTTPAIASTDGVKEVGDYLRGLNALQADFRQITIPADGGPALEASGTFYLLRPNRFLWEYDKPSPQRIVADGKRIYVHDVELNQVTQTSQKKVLDGTPAQLLASREPPEKYFRIRDIDRGDNRTWAELIPKTQDTEVAKLQIAFMDGELDTMLMEDRFGQLTRFVFTNVDRNPRLQYSMFRFKRPPGADYLDMD
ncbi:MAG: outer membrane lipoprotein chaperone LolA [Thiohalocapsa sp.]|uniref:outer membrane lipoprotein chaperone LolA n=1 Tax=Thiohalocapsa sp. TaxID=2497641 RepID=UPI0025D54C02|nr:outer membrane lipoprotein chaperone LolA [Thiohalocapsa sp.]MCG6942571.1 outer membrane lipoprotein chaperone LolA [Thiohalocapsa sp.]